MNNELKTINRKLKGAKMKHKNKIIFLLLVLVISTLSIASITKKNDALIKSDVVYTKIFLERTSKYFELIMSSEENDQQSYDQLNDFIFLSYYAINTLSSHLGIHENIYFGQALADVNISSNSNQTDLKELSDYISELKTKLNAVQQNDRGYFNIKDLKKLMTDIN